MRAGAKEFEQALDATPAIALVEADRVDQAMHAASACIAGGHRLVAVSARVPDFMELVRALVPRHDLLVGVALPDDAASAAAAFADGACFVLAADVDAAVGEAAKSSGAVWLPGVLSPGEARAAQAAGARHAHVYPALAGPALLRHLRRVAPGLALVVGGARESDAMESWMAAGARAVVLDEAVASPELLAAGDMMAIRARAASTHREASRLSLRARGTL
jgi:2-dehydro-3-deoxyphosphogluconate aldolase/(4S)-4-hydroxy-2-oxoglutarate aldolase